MSRKLEDARKALDNACEVYDEAVKVWEDARTVTLEVELVTLLNTATTHLLVGDDSFGSVAALGLIERYHKARRDGIPQTRLRCMFGNYHGSDECADLLEAEISRRGE